MSFGGKITFVGAGNMAAAIIAGLVRADASASSRITAVDVSESTLQRLHDLHGVGTSTDAATAVRGADVVVLAVKPQVVEAVLPRVREGVGAEALVVSIVAGVTSKTLEAGLPPGTRVVRTMPNTPALVGRGATAIAAGTHATEGDLTTTSALFDAVGLTVTVPEKLLDAVTGLSGSGPAYVFLFLEALADGGVREGLPRDTALRLAAQTVLGAATMMLETGAHPGMLKDQVTSPGGTTIAAVEALEGRAFRGTVMSAVSAATARSRALSGS
ncbi:MAG: pyrroline-5-carboxylate reductase [Polyangiales bacterium]|nr:pyrroline-5-carboxylate reductase [Myxococcales bacterium]MCB9659049.1 pyrroline-5-carboxylate reductase [Sandaracinaceae bacterium]